MRRNFTTQWWRTRKCPDFFSPLPSESVFVVCDRNKDCDPSVVLHNNHDLDSTKSFIHIHTPGNAIPKFETVEWKTGRHLAPGQKYWCKDCEAISSARRLDPNGSSELTFRKGWYPATGQSDIDFIHHMKTKYVLHAGDKCTRLTILYHRHLRYPCEEDVVYAT